MPADRLTHPRIGRSRKVTALNDLEFRVWDTYRWAADDFGVAPKNAEFLRGMNDALRIQHTEVEIAAALHRLVELQVIIEFDHQGAPYVCSLEWNKHQKIKYPRQTFCPAPPPEVIKRMDVTTRRLFKTFHEYFLKIPASRARVRAKRLTLTANANAGAVREGSGEGTPPDDGALRARFERFWEAYPRQVGKDAAWLEWKRRAPDDALTDLMIAKVGEQRRSRGWRKDNGDFIPKPTTWLGEGRWQDQSEITPPPDDSAGAVCTETWNKVLTLIRPRIDGCAYARYLATLHAMFESADTFTVLAPSREHRDFIPAEIEQQLATAVDEVCHKRLHFMWGSSGPQPSLPDDSNAAQPHGR